VDDPGGILRNEGRAEKNHKKLSSVDLIIPVSILKLNCHVETINAPNCALKGYRSHRYKGPSVIRFKTPDRGGGRGVLTETEGGVQGNLPWHKKGRHACMD